tara:strand:+ start:243 stop:392 length:150 start_codon:yes stop_codon:yes gene_type:complete
MELKQRLQDSIARLEALEAEYALLQERLQDATIKLGAELLELQAIQREM